MLQYKQVGGFFRIVKNPPSLEKSAESAKSAAAEKSAGVATLPILKILYGEILRPIFIYRRPRSYSKIVVTISHQIYFLYPVGLHRTTEKTVASQVLKCFGVIDRTQ